ncbi:MAG: hypothetical protein E5X83_29785 [Mesorhizobium sp.]|nr:MAG: hypothetical protein EOQ90_17200 [Mesorhizobium sp.]RWM66472.1 MAG: hypothetical protein EOR82_29345 [Mesorhizobium sp.]RWM85754.1 MAG: hypothetical protein EOR83_10845 [Mesorhizobium sp.]TIO21401.1 MAG: hypothetical protein E5X83_29785 [Mesorhizobium sp.]TJV54959.1 MAG: hypothetical protein E5X82_29370 [Mesorhizobium sp.]
MSASPLSVGEQIAAMKATWPQFAARNIDRRAQSVRWVGDVRPQHSRYTLEIRYRIGTQPEVRIVAPVLVRLPGNEEGQLPHVYPPVDDPTLCLFDPENNEWDASMRISETTVPWALDWLACYELWLMTGRWTGGGRHAGQPRVASTEDRIQ